MCVDTLEAALWSVWTTDSFADAVLTAANLADDADSVAAVAGQLAGALYGASAIPPEWLKTLAWRHMIEGIGRYALDGEPAIGSRPSCPTNLTARDRMHGLHASWG